MVARDKKVEPRKPGARRTPEERAKISAAIVKDMTLGMSMNQACFKNKVTSSRFMDWVSADPVLAESYARAREALIEKMAEDLLLIADAPVGSTDSGATDSGAVQKQRLQVDARKWLLSKLAPKKYGDKVQQEITGAEGGPIEYKQIVINGK